MTINTGFIPHLGFCSTPFKASFEDKNTAVVCLTMLLSYQGYLAKENHSQYPKSRIEAYSADGELDNRATASLADSVSNHKYASFDPVSDFKNCADADKSGLQLIWFPQVPCKPFYFPVASVEMAEIMMDLMAKYDLYLLEDCSEMRVDFCNTGDLLMRDEEMDPEDPWCSWFFEKDDVYFDSFSEYLESKEQDEE